MILEELENQLRPHIRHQSLTEIPGFPSADFVTVQDRVADGSYSLGVDFTFANKLSLTAYGRAWALMSWFLAAFPVIITILSVFVAVLSKRFWLLMVIPSSFFAYLLGNPYNPARKLCSLVSLVVFFASLVAWASQDQYHTLSWIGLSFGASYWTVRFLYRVNHARLRRLALSSETLMIALFELGKLGILDRKSGESFWASETGGDDAALQTDTADSVATGSVNAEGSGNAADLVAVDALESEADQMLFDGTFEGAISRYKEVISLDPARLHIYHRLMEVYARTGRTVEAESQRRVLAEYYLKSGRRQDLDDLAEEAAGLGIGPD